MRGLISRLESSFLRVHDSIGVTKAEFAKVKPLMAATYTEMYNQSPLSPVIDHLLENVDVRGMSKKEIALKLAFEKWRGCVELPPIRREFIMLPEDKENTDCEDERSEARYSWEKIE